VAAVKGKTILVVDDEPCILEALGEILAWEGFDVRTAADGRAALEQLAAGPVDVVLMDVMMPVMGGVEAVAAMRRDPRLAGIPVVFMSAGLIPDGAVRALAIRKPFTLPLLLSVLQRALARDGA
jgi:CheY-like chemotaxis protein